MFRVLFDVYSVEELNKELHIDFYHKELLSSDPYLLFKRVENLIAALYRKWYNKVCEKWQREERALRQAFIQKHH